MSWDDLRYFLAAFRHGSLAGAARELGCEYTTVGRRITALEQALGATLFMRTSDGLVPTQIARDLVPLAEQMERCAHDIATRAAGHDDELRGTVRITCPEGFSAYVVDNLPALRAAHPEIVVEIIADVRQLDLARGEADIALRMNPPAQPDLVARTLCPMTWRMFASDEYLTRHGAPQPIDDLRGHDVVTFDDALAHVPGARWLADHAAGANIVLRGNSLHAVLDAAAAGLGLAVLPHFLATRDGRLRVVAPDVLGTRTLCLVVHPELRTNARIRIVIDFLVAAILRDHARGLFG